MTWTNILKPILEKCNEENIRMEIRMSHEMGYGEDALIIKLCKLRTGIVRVIPLENLEEYAFYESEELVNTILDNALEELNKNEDEFLAKESDEIHQTILTNIKKED